MILRRLAESIRRQDWFTVLVEIVIVVIGVFIGIEMANWNESRIEQDQLSEQLEGLRAEMDSNLQRIAAHRAWSDGQFRTATALRTALASDPPVFEATEFNAQLLASPGSYPGAGHQPMPRFSGTFAVIKPGAQK